MSLDASSGIHAVTSIALVATAIYLIVRLTTLGWGWLLLISVPLFIAELLAYVQLLLLSFQAWRIPTHPFRFGADRHCADIVVDASRADASMLERTLVGAQSVESRGRLHVLDLEHRDDVAELCGTFRAEYSVDPRLRKVSAAVVFEHATSELYLWLEGGQVPMPEVISGM